MFLMFLIPCFVNYIVALFFGSEVQAFLGVAIRLTNSGHILACGPSSFSALFSFITPVIVLEAFATPARIPLDRPAGKQFR